MRFSLIVSAYNIEEYLKECMDSLLAQPVGLEVVLVDDGSTDSTPQMCDEYAKNDKRVKVLHTKNGGTSAARNAGAAVAEGDYMIFIDGDDMLVKDCLAGVDRELRAKNDPDFIICQIDRYIHETKEILPYNGAEGFKECKNIDEFAALVTKKANSFSVSTCRYAINSAFYRSKNLAFDNGVWHEDEHFTPLMMNEAESFAAYEGGFYLYRRHQGSKFFTAELKNILEFINVAAILAAQRDKRPKSREKAELLTFRSQYLFKRGINEGIAVKGRTVPEIKKAALHALEVDENMLELVPKLKKYVRVLGKSAGVGCYLRMLKLKRRLHGGK